jgi:DNA polymerase-3 subunit gamma/tau
MTVTDVRRLWPEVLEEVKGRRRFTWILLSQNAQVAEVRDRTLLLAMANAGARDSFSRGGSEDVLHEALIVVLGTDFTVETMVDAGATTGAPERSRTAPASWDARPPRDAPLGQQPVEPRGPDPRDDGAPAAAAAPVVDPALQARAREGIRPTRSGGAGAADAPDDRDANVDLRDSDLEESAESHTELLARHLGAEVIAEEDGGA